MVAIILINEEATKAKTSVKLGQMAVAGKDLLETEKREKGKLRQSRVFFVLLKQIDPSWSHLCLYAFLTCSLGGPPGLLAEEWLTVFCAVVSLRDLHPALESIFFL